jgi:hypothetical protein
MGRPTTVPEIASSITYSDNGLVKKITHASTVTFTQIPDSSGMARPGTLSTNRNWQEEKYSYDASGNIEKIGTKTFSYDLSSRLTSVMIPGAVLPNASTAYYGATNDITVITDSASGRVITVDYGWIRQ